MYICVWQDDICVWQYDTDIMTWQIDMTRWHDRVCVEISRNYDGNKKNKTWMYLREIDMKLKEFGKTMSAVV